MRIHLRVWLTRLVIVFTIFLFGACDPQLPITPNSTTPQTLHPQSFDTNTNIQVPQASMPLPTSIPTPTPAPEVMFHIVKKGEWLASIAPLYDISWQEIASANGLQGDAANNLTVGQRLVIPRGRINGSREIVQPTIEQQHVTQRDINTDAQPVTVGSNSSQERCWPSYEYVQPWLEVEETMVLSYEDWEMGLCGTIYGGYRVVTDYDEHLQAEEFTTIYIDPTRRDEIVEFNERHRYYEAFPNGRGPAPLYDGCLDLVALSKYGYYSLDWDWRDGVPVGSVYNFSDQFPNGWGDRLFDVFPNPDQYADLSGPMYCCQKRVFQNGGWVRYYLWVSEDASVVVTGITSFSHTPEVTPLPDQCKAILEE